jgi:3-hydroxyisobutyrate dehydrogenase-like beta-hydroxyacid dehydrogenase
MAHIAFLGTGLLGAAFVEAALGRGDQVSVWNRTASKAQALAKFGAQVASTPAEAVRGAERVHLVLNDDASVDEVIGAFRDALDPGAIIVDHTTTAPAPTGERARRLAGDGIRYLHCPVFIGPVAARRSEGTILACGPREWFEQVRPALERQAARVDYLGERPDVAATFKLASNAFFATVIGLTADLLTMGRQAGISFEDMLARIDGFTARGALGVRGGMMVAREFAPMFELVTARKDVRLMIETAATDDLAVLPGLAARMDALIEAGHGGDDIAVLGWDVGKADRR